MKKIFFAILLLGSIPCNAQTKFGIQGGVLGTSFKAKAEGWDNMKYKITTGYKLGVFAEIPTSEHVFINPALNLVHKGGKAESYIENEAGSGTISVTTKTNYLEMPVNLIYKLNGRGGNGFYSGAGPVLGMGLGGEIITAAKDTSDEGPINESESTPVKFDGKDTDDDHAHLKRFEWGANAFAGYQLSNGLGFQLQYRPNFTNISLEKDVSYKNSYFGLSLSYRF